MLGKMPSSIEGQGIGKMTERRKAEIVSEAHQEAIAARQAGKNSSSLSGRLAERGIDLERLSREAKKEAEEIVGNGAKNRGERLKIVEGNINKWLNEAEATLGIKKEQ